MREPLWWIWLSVFARLLLVGDDYFMQPRGSVRDSARIASVIWGACRSIRQGARR